MALNLPNKYPGRFNAPSAGYPQGSFKNRSAPGALDGSYLEKDWANDKEGFFQSLIAAAGIVPNELVDEVGASQYFDALQQVIADGLVVPDASETVKGIIEIATSAEAQAGADTVRAVTPAGLAAREASRRFVSSLLTITPAGSLTVPHGLGSRPVFVSAELVCQTAEVGYSAGAVVPVSVNQLSGSASYGVAAVPDATNVNLRYGSSGGAFVLINFSTGGLANITPANWRLRIIAEL